MKFKMCPNCGKPLDTYKGTAHCSRCGQSALEDSQVIRITRGEIGGPGMSNLQNAQQEMVIQGGMAVESADAGEKMRTFKVSEGTVEEKAEFQWKAKDSHARKEPPARSPKPVPRSGNRPVRKSAGTHKSKQGKGPGTSRAPRATEVEEKKPAEKKSRTTRTSKGYPGHYQYLFYGIPGALLLVLILFTIWKVFLR